MTAALWPMSGGRLADHRVFEECERWILQRPSSVDLNQLIIMSAEGSGLGRIEAWEIERLDIDGAVLVKLGDLDRNAEGRVHRISKVPRIAPSHRCTVCGGDVGFDLWRQTAWDVYIDVDGPHDPERAMVTDKHGGPVTARRQIVQTATGHRDCLLWLREGDVEVQA